MNKQTETVLNYHNRTKHRLERYAKGPESIDWEDQPDQFRRFSGCEIVKLAKPGLELETLFANLDDHDPEYFHVSLDLSPVRRRLQDRGYRELRRRSLYQKP